MRDNYELTTTQAIIPASNVIIPEPNFIVPYADPVPCVENSNYSEDDFWSSYRGEENHFQQYKLRPPNWEGELLERYYSEYKRDSGSIWISKDFMYKNAFSFIKSQFLRFNLPEPSSEILSYIWVTTTDLIDYDDDYLIYGEYCDIEPRSYSRFYQMYKKEEKTGYIIEVDPTTTEIFVSVKYDPSKWYYLHDNPGIETICHIIQDSFDTWHREDNLCSYPGYKHIKEYCHVKHGLDFYDVMSLGVWAGILWTLSEEAREWRSQNELIYMCYNQGSVVLEKGHLEFSNQYHLTNRPAKSCVVCMGKPFCVAPLLNVPQDHYMYRYYAHWRMTQHHDVRTDSLPEGVFYACTHCASKLVHPIPYCLRTGCRNTGCQHHVLQHQHSNNLLV